ncbi:uncharacterized protein BROUX77_001537 [Berkeleyomyces rouxiae]|uniref:uncharacterized protein n=1 Tax=Berkeleyomyces rouxiae TaxID=2035830 RepID=UPI003B7A765E
MVATIGTGGKDPAQSITPEPPPPFKISTKIAVERLASNVNEGHLHEIFSQFGAIDDFDLPKTNLGLNRGTAYIIYLNEDDAETAITHMHEAQIDSATINVSIVPRDSKFHYFPPLAQHHESSGHNRNNGGGSYRRQPPIDPNTSRGSGRERERHGADIYRPGECEKMKTPTPRRKIGKSLTSGSDAKRPKDN